MDISSSNITMRRKNIPAMNMSMDGDLFHEGEHSFMDASSTSLPDISVGGHVQIRELKEENDRLQLQLDSAHEEIENLNLLNINLQQKLSDAYKIINMYKQVCTDDLHLSTRRNYCSQASSPVSRKRTDCPAMTLTPILNIQKSKNTSSANKTTTNILSSLDISKLQYLSGESQFYQEKSQQINISAIAPPSKEQLDLRYMINNNDIEELNKIQPQSLVRQLVSNQNSSVLPPPSGGATCILKKKDSTVKQIVILGGDQIRGLSSELSRSRAGKWNDSYETFANITRNASCYNIFKPCKELCKSLTKKDYVILHAGNQDSGLNYVSHQFKNTLSKLTNTNVLILPVHFNTYLNGSLLNANFRKLAQTYQNCTYVDIDVNMISSKRILIDALCNKINLIIDSDEYRLKYLTFGPNSIVRNRLSGKKESHADRNTSKVPQRGTIPFYFQKQALSKMSSNNTGANQPENLPQKGTIPFYFLKQSYIKKSSKATSTTPPKTFFRD